MREPGRPPPLVVVGGSAGALRPLCEIVAALPASLSATVCVVIHLPAGSPSSLARVLERAGAMEATFAEVGLPLLAGRIAVAPPGHHLLVQDGTLTLSEAPPEHGTRPSIDPLFRSAASAAGPDVVSVILSGALDDGAAGTVAVRSAGGMTIAQEPSDAEFPDMPRNAIRTGQVVAMLPSAAIPAAIVEAVEAIGARRRRDEARESRNRPRRRTTRPVRSRRDRVGPAGDD